jgi:hypothetical protein
MKDCVIATSWYSSGKPTNATSAARIYEPEWFKLWQRYHGAPAAYSVFISNCAVIPNVFGFHDISYAVVNNVKYHSRHDWWSGLLSGAMYAYNNGLDLVFIEQDCFVHGLQKAIDWAREQKAKICYGFDNYVCYAPGWAESSLTYVDRTYLCDFIYKVMQTEGDREKRYYCEKIFQALYEKDFTPWPFGYGRKKVLNWKAPIFYKQQLTNDEIDKFLELKNA